MRIKTAMNQRELQAYYQRVVSVICPRCLARPGEPCKGRNGSPKATPHPRREKRFFGTGTFLPISPGLSKCDGWEPTEGRGIPSKLCR